MDILTPLPPMIVLTPSLELCQGIFFSFNEHLHLPHCQSLFTFTIGHPFVASFVLACVSTSNSKFPTLIQHCSFFVRGAIFFYPGMINGKRNCMRQLDKATRFCSAGALSPIVTQMLMFSPETQLTQNNKEPGCHTNPHAVLSSVYLMHMPMLVNITGQKEI